MVQPSQTTDVADILVWYFWASGDVSTYCVNFTLIVARCFEKWKKTQSTDELESIVRQSMIDYLMEIKQKQNAQSKSYEKFY